MPNHKITLLILLHKYFEGNSTIRNLFQFRDFYKKHFFRLRLCRILNIVCRIIMAKT